MPDRIVGTWTAYDAEAGEMASAPQIKTSRLLVINREARPFKRSGPRKKKLSGSAAPRGRAPARTGRPSTSSTAAAKARDWAAGAARAQDWPEWQPNSM